MSTYLLALFAACLLYDAQSQKEYEIQLFLKKIFLSRFSYEELAGSYYIEFGDGESLSDLVKQLKRL